jgi:hypothetical protein
MRLLAPLQILFYSSLWCIKFSFLVFFYRLSSKIKAFRIWWFVVCFCTAAVYIASVGDIEYKCSFEGIEYIIRKYQKRQKGRPRQLERRLKLDRGMYQAGAYPLRKSQLLGELCWRCHYRLDE